MPRNPTPTDSKIVIDIYRTPYGDVRLTEEESAIILAAEGQRGRGYTRERRAKNALVSQLHERARRASGAA